MVLPEQGSYQHVGQMFRGVPRKVFPHGQNQCPEGENFKLPADFTRIHSQGMGEALGLHPSLPVPRNGGLAHALELLRRAHAHVEWAR